MNRPGCNPLKSTIMADSLLSSSDAARLLGVGSATVKRWADAGLLACEKTVGHHRRFRREEIARFLRERPHGPPGGADGWVDLLVWTADAHAIQGRLLAERARLGSWTATATSLTPVLDALGVQWADGRLSILEEHLASERLSRALARCAEALPSQEGGLRVLLAASEDEEHTLGLSLLEIVARETGATTLWAGRQTPTTSLAESLDAIDVLALSASRLRDEKRLARDAVQLIKAADAAEARIAFGGSGRWPDVHAPHTRLEDFARFRDWLLEP